MTDEGLKEQMVLPERNLFRAAEGSLLPGSSGEWPRKEDEPLIKMSTAGRQQGEELSSSSWIAATP